MYPFPFASDSLSMMAGRVNPFMAFGSMPYAGMFSGATQNPMLGMKTMGAKRPMSTGGNSNVTLGPGGGQGTFGNSPVMSTLQRWLGGGPSGGQNPFLRFSF